MATHKIGKLKFNLSRQGLAYKWGDGEVHRFSFERTPRAEEDEYEDGAYAYDDGYADDYSDDYNDTYYEDDDRGRGAYDRYGRADNDDYYENASDYDDPDGRYSDYADESEAPNSFMQYVEDNDWVTLLLLVLLPPLGIYLLWRRLRYEQPVRIGLSIAALIWFLVLLFWLIPSLFGGRRDTTTQQRPVMSLTTQMPSPSASAAPSATPAADGSLSLIDADDAASATALPTGTADVLSGLLDVDPDASPSATPLAGAAGTGATGSDYVYSPATGIYYHAVADCPSIPAGVTTTRMALSAAQNRGQSACPVCYGGTLYYATANGIHYHSDPSCSKMVNPTTITKEAAEAQGKTACPVCILKTSTALTTGAPGSYSGILSSVTSDKSGTKVWATAGGKNYHTKSNCRGMTGASQVSLLQAIKAGKTACSTCCASAGTKVWCTKNGKSYHSKSNCSGMTGASQVTYAEALVLGKSRCTVCYGSSGSGASGGGSASSGDVYVYATANGKYYHSRSNCTGMTGASRVTLQSMLNAGRPACPTCCGSANTTVYANSGGKYYHSKASCRGMSNAPATSLAKALAGGKAKCPYCWGSGGSGSGSGSGSSKSDSVYVYATSSGKYYHTNSTCGGMTNARRVTLSSMLASGRPACPTCASGASRTVYAAKNDKYYHYTKSHAGSGATAGNLADALAYGLRACPACVTGSSKGGGQKKSSSGYTNGTSGVKVYATVNGKYYHTKSTCTGMSGAAYVSLETALNAGKTACPTCATTAARTVYATSSGKYYHYTKAHAGSGARSASLGEALAYGLKPCPTCVSSSGSQPSKSHNYKPGTSGISVYANVKGKYYHTKSTCTGMSGASKVSLETALNYGKTACPVCASSAGRKVYGTKTGKYYHYSRLDAGSGAKSGTLGMALAYGLKPCPNCVTNSGGGSGGSGGGGSSEPTAPPAPGDTSVYVDLNGNSLRYHKAKKCSAAGMSSGTAVTLNFALDQGFSACPYCNPPRSTTD